MSARTGIRFYAPERIIEVSADAVEALRGELEKIAATNPPRPDVTNLIDTLELHVVDLDKPGSSFTPDDRERAILLRATDHLRNFGHAGDVLDLRDMLSGTGAVEPIPYRLRGITGGPVLGFVSYSLEYDMDDRLVDAAGGQHRVAGIGLGDPLELVVDEWRPGSRSMPHSSTPQSD